MTINCVCFPALKECVLVRMHCIKALELSFVHIRLGVALPAEVVTHERALRLYVIL